MILKMHRQNSCLNKAEGRSIADCLEGMSCPQRIVSGAVLTGCWCATRAVNVGRQILRDQGSSPIEEQHSRPARTIPGGRGAVTRRGSGFGRCFRAISCRKLLFSRNERKSLAAQRYSCRAKKIENRSTDSTATSSSCTGSWKCSTLSMVGVRIIASLAPCGRAAVRQSSEFLPSSAAGLGRSSDCNYWRAETAARTEGRSGGNTRRTLESSTGPAEESDLPSFAVVAAAHRLTERRE